MRWFYFHWQISCCTARTCKSIIRQWVFLVQTCIFNETKTTKTITKTKTTTKTIAKTKKKDKDIDIKILQVNLSHRFHQLSVVHFEWEKDNCIDNYKDKDINIESLQAYLSRKFHQLSSGSSWCRLTFWMRPQFLERRVFEIWYLENINYSQNFWNMKFADYCFGNLEQSSTNMKFSEYCFWNPKLVTKQYLQDIVLRIASNFQNLKFEKYCFGNLKPCTEHNMNIAGYWN